jgi:hypothetical protein
LSNAVPPSLVSRTQTQLSATYACCDPITLVRRWNLISLMTVQSHHSWVRNESILDCVAPTRSSLSKIVFRRDPIHRVFIKSYYGKHQNRPPPVMRDVCPNPSVFYNRLKFEYYQIIRFYDLDQQEMFAISGRSSLSDVSCSPWMVSSLEKSAPRLIGTRSASFITPMTSNVCEIWYDVSLTPSCRRCCQ